MKVCNMSVFINMHDSKDAQDFWSVTCHGMQAFEKTSFVFSFVYFTRANKSTNFLLSLQILMHLTMKEAVSVFHKHNSHLK